MSHLLCAQPLSFEAVEVISLDSGQTSHWEHDVRQVQTGSLASSTSQMRAVANPTKYTPSSRLQQRTLLYQL